MSARWGDLIEVSNDKGPYKLAKFRSDSHEFMAQIIDPYGIQGSPPKGSQALLIPVDGDEGKMIAFVMPPPKDRSDGLKAGEAQLKNHVAGQFIYQMENGDTVVSNKDGTAVITLTAAGVIEITAATHLIINSAKVSHRSM